MSVDDFTPAREVEEPRLLSDCKPGEIVVIKWDDNHRTAMHGEEVPVFFYWSKVTGEGKKKKRSGTCFVKLVNPETLEVYDWGYDRVYNAYTIQDCPVIESIAKSKYDFSGEVTSMSDRGGDINDPLARNQDKALELVNTQELDKVMPISEKVKYVKAQSQTRSHHCHWPGCDKQVPPAMWGCKDHWYSLPKPLRDRIWKTYNPGQEKNWSPSDSYIEAAADVQEWIRSKLERDRREANHKKTRGAR